MPINRKSSGSAERKKRNEKVKLEFDRGSKKRLVDIDRHSQQHLDSNNNSNQVWQVSKKKLEKYSNTTLKQVDTVEERDSACKWHK